MILAKESASDRPAEPKRVATVLLVDDDEKLRQLVAGFLERHGLDVLCAADGQSADALLARHPVDVVILDVMLPGEDGLSICRRLTGSSEARPAVIMLSAAAEDTDRIVGLELGADDYLPKPANPRELLARIRALLRRSVTVQQADPTPPHLGYEFAGWTLSIWARELQTPDGVIVPLTGGEFALLRTFVEHPREVLDRDRVLSLVRGRSSFAFDRAVDLQLSRLRRKLTSTYGEAGNLFRTVRNEGYIFVAAVRRV
ncbi:MAG: ompR [Caulobacteraceae bacterium]|nr:ompR [Caulobacteraceae bacterium]